MSFVKLLIENKLPLYWEYNYRSFLNYMQQVKYGFQGTVTDLETGLPVKARLTLIGHDQDNSFVYSDSNSGDFYRPVFEETYDLKFSAPGYFDKIIESKSISNYEAVVLNVTMEKSAGIDENKLSSLFVISPNPVSDFLSIKYSGKKKLNCSVSIVTASGETVYYYETEFSGNSSEEKIDLTIYSQGVYFLRITSDGISVNKKIVKR